MTAIFSFRVNRWLPRYALAFADLIAQQFQAKISFETVHYRFPNSIIFKNVKALEVGGSPMLQASQVVMDFSFPLFSSATPLNNIIMNDLVINGPVFKDYLTRHNKKIYALAKALPKGNMRLLVPNGRLYLINDVKGEPLPFKIDIRLNQGRVNVHGSWGLRSSMDLWGSWHDNNIDWKGFIFYDRFYILDIDGLLKIQPKDIVLQQLSFSVNGDAVGALGHCSKQDLFQCDADVAFKDTTLHLHAQNTPQGLVFKGAVDFNRVHLDFEDLKARIVNGDFLKLEIGQIQSIFYIQSHRYRLPFENLLASVHFTKSYQEDIAMSAGIYAGDLHGRIFLDSTSWPWQIKGQGKFEGIDMEGHGLLSGNFDFQSSRNIELTGTLALHNGNLNNSDLQEWMAKTLQMPSLSHVSGADLSCRFKISRSPGEGGSIMVEDLKLNTHDFDLSGFFHLDADDLVSSHGWVHFSKGLLSESPIGRKIIGLVGGAWSLPFEFTLSGNLHRMNFQWDNSPLKDKVRQHMFSFFEGMVDRRMDAAPSIK